MNAICVVHLVRAKNGWAPFEAFATSYRMHAAGMAHDLLIVLKGFSGDDAVQPFLQEAGALGARTFAISDLGFDLRAYHLAAQFFDYSYFCFLNSFSEILGDDWLAKMYAVIQTQGVGLVGATASCESMYTNVLVEKASQTEASLLRRLATAVRSGYCRLCFDPFPNYHIRTNAFLIPRSVMLRVWPQWMPAKRGAYLLEAGRNNLTKRINRSGLSAMVVGNDGQAYEREQWTASRTFRQQHQENLLIADNQTREYANATPAIRRHLTLLAWGNKAQAREIQSDSMQ